MLGFPRTKIPKHPKTDKPTRHPQVSFCHNTLFILSQAYDSHTHAYECKNDRQATPPAHGGKTFHHTSPKTAQAVEKRIESAENLHFQPKNVHFQPGYMHFQLGNVHF